MKGIICYYSGSGNTRLACTYIKQKIQNINFELFDIVNDKNIDFSEFDIIGFATFTDAWGVSKKFADFIAQIDGLNKYSFIFNTYGCISGKTQSVMKRIVSKKGFHIISGHSLHCPENYPPMIVSNQAFENSPNTTELNEFNEFISELDQKISNLIQKKEVVYTPIKIKAINLLPKWIAEVYGSISGKSFFINEERCTKCGKCEKVCPYQAINIGVDMPVIHKDKCQACWACYNHCPNKAVNTKKYTGEGQYSQPNRHLSNLLK